MPQRIINSIKQKSQRYRHYKYNYPPSNNNHFQILSEGNQFFPDMLNAIENAQSSICIIQYIFETSLTSNRFIQALLQARDRNVKVHIILDAYGSRGLSIQEREKMIDHGIKIYMFNPLKKHHLIKFLYRDHRKLLIIDKTTAFLGGAGISDDYNFPSEHIQSWRDLVIKMNGPIVQDCSLIFYKQKYFSTNNPATQIESINTSNLNLNDKQARLLTSHSWYHNEIQRAIIHATKKSANKVWITTPYFVPTRKLKKHLKLAAYRGCDVRLLLPGTNSDHPWISQVARQLYSRLLKNKIKIYEYQPRFTHAKAILCDEWVCIGSSNLDKWNQKFNLELNIEIQSNQLAQQLNAFFEQGFKDAKQIDPAIWESRSRQQRIREWFWSKVAMWLERFIHNMR